MSIRPWTPERIAFPELSMALADSLILSSSQREIRYGVMPMNAIVLYVAAALTGLWGLAHLFATRGVVAGFGQLSPENRLIITMEWIVEGVALISTAAFVVVATVNPSAGSSATYMVATGTLVVLTVVSLFTGFKVAFLPFRLCPFVFGLSAALIVSGAWL
jgi:hypothetical protein